jgi:ribosomal protein S18 acetylase RimI-like enzyme
VGKAAVALRAAAPSDEDFLRSVHVDAHPEFATLPFPAADVARVLDLQLAAQRDQYRAAHPSSRDQVIEVGGEPVGRCWTAETADEIRVLDLAVLARHRGLGIATCVLTQLRERAATSGRALRLSVWFANDAARRLYERLGFEPVAERGGYVALQWSADSPLEPAVP